MSSKLSPFSKLRFHSKRRMTTLTVHQKSLSLSVRTGSYTIGEKTGSRKEVLWSSPGYGEGERKSLPSCLVSKKLSSFYFTSTVSIAFLQHFVNHWLTYGLKRKINAWMFCVCPHNLSKHVISRARVGRLCTTIDRKHHVHIFKKWQAKNLFYQTLCTNDLNITKSIIFLRAPFMADILLWPHEFTILAARKPRTRIGFCTLC